MQDVRTISLLTEDAVDCPNCSARILARVRGMDGVLNAELDATPDAPAVRYTFDTARVRAEQVTALVQEVLADNRSHFTHQVLPIEGMDCADCAMTLEKGVGRMPGVAQAEVNFGAARMIVEFDRRETDLDAIDKRVNELGYSISKAPAGYVSERSAAWKVVTERDNLQTLAAALLTVVGGVGQLLGASSTFSIAAYAAAVVVAGVPLAAKALRVLRNTRSLDINVLMTIAVIGAALIGEWFEAATVVVLFSFGEALEGYAMDRVRRSVRSLLSLTPKTVLVQRAGGEIEMPLEQVEVNELVLVRAGTTIALDGVVVQGTSAVDQASLTGESLPVSKEIGDQVFAGTVNGSGPLVMRVTRLVGDSSIARIIRMVEHAQGQRAPVQRVVDRFAKVYTPIVIALAVAIATVPPLIGGDWLEWVTRALVLLVIACPCALVLSTPISIVSALSAAARHGVLVKGGAALERIGSLDTVAFDKTGTVTHGKPNLTDIIPIGVSSDDALRLAASLERHSEHPLGEAVVNAARAGGIELAEPQHVRVLPGRGLLGTLDGVEYAIGSHKLFAETELDSRVQEAITTIENRGGTSALLGRGDQILAVIGFGDTLRADAPAAVAALRSAGVRDVVMLSGDSRGAVEKVAGALNIDRAQHGLLPEEKLAAIHDLKLGSNGVAMVGDGVNDAPALAAADIGVAMGVVGTDAAVETADVALMGDDLTGLAATIRHGRRTKRIIGINIALALITKLIVLALAVAGIANLWMAIAADVGTSLVVIALGMTLLRWSGSDKQPPAPAPARSHATMAPANS